MPYGERRAPSKPKVIRHGSPLPQQLLLVVILLVHIFEGVVLLAEMFDQSLCAW